MKPAAFRYLRPESLEEALAALRQHGGDAKILAGGQSLLPLLNFRMLRPAVLIDINRIAELDHLDAAENGGVTIGSLTRHFTLETSATIRGRFPVLQHAVSYVAHLAIRNRGTTGGSLAHADPAAELPMMAVLLDAILTLRTVDRVRTVSAEEFFLGALTTMLDEDEIITEVSLPPLAPHIGWGFEEFALRSGDFAFAAASALLEVEDAKVTRATIALMGVDETPVRISEAESILLGQRFGDEVIRAAVESVRRAVNPNSDLRASAEYRRHLAGVLSGRALDTAWRTAKEPRA